MSPNYFMKGMLLILVLNVQFVFAQDLPVYLPQEGLIGWWPFNGNVMDESGNENNGAILGSIIPSDDRYGEPNKAYEFPGNSSSYIDIDYNGTFNDLIEGFSLSAWYWSDQSRNTGRVLALGDSDNRSGNRDNAFHITGFPNTGIMLRVPDESSLFGNWGGAVSNQEANTWHHLVLSVNFSDSTWVIYYNGSEIERDTAPSINSILPLNWKGKSFNIGRKAVSAFDAWDGKIDDIGIWNRALSAEEAKQLYSGIIEDQSVCRDVPTVELLCTDLPRYAPSSNDCNFEFTPNPNALGGEIPGFTYGGFFNGHHYYVYKEPTNWTTGDSITRANGGYLTCIGSEDENAFVAGLTSNNIWIGFYRNPETCEYQWVNCEEVSYTKWASTEPNNQPCGEPYVQIINGCSSNRYFWNNLGNNSANGNCHSNMVPIMEVDPADYLPDDMEDDQEIDQGTDNWNLFFEDSLSLENVLTVQEDSSYKFENLSTIADVDECGEGTVIRSYRVYTSSEEDTIISDTCSMTVHFSAVHDYSISIPPDQVIRECENTCDTEAVLINFNDCELSNSGFFPINVDNPDGSFSANITDNGFDGCGVTISRPNGLVSDQSFGYGTYTLRARSGGSTSNQGLGLLVSDEDYSDRGIVADIRQAGTDDAGWAFYVQGEKVADGPRNTVPTNYPDWYQIKVRVTPDSISFSVNNTLMYESSEHTLDGVCGQVLIGTFANSIYDDFEYTPYERQTDPMVAEIPKVEVTTTGCDMINTSFSDRTLESQIGACYQLERIFRIINWCEYDGDGEPMVLNRIEESVQSYLLTVDYLETSEFTGTNPTVISFINSAGEFFDSLSFEDYSSKGSTGYFEYTQQIEVYDESPPILNVEDTLHVFSNIAGTDECMGNIQIQVSVLDSCNYIQSDWSVVSAYLDLEAHSEVFERELDIVEEVYKLDKYTIDIDAAVPIGRHAIQLMVADPCGNTTETQIEISVVDSLAPMAVCRTEWVVNLMEEESETLPTAYIIADSLLIDKGSDCSGIEPVGKLFSIAPNSIQPITDDIYLDLREFSGMVEVNFTATQRSGIFHNIIIPEVDTFAENSGRTTITLEGGKLYGPCLPYSNFSGTNLYIGDEVVPTVRSSGTKTNKSLVCEEGGDDWEDMVLTVDAGYFIRITASDILGLYGIKEDSDFVDQLSFNCRDLGVQRLGIAVSDVSGNVNICETTITVEDKAQFCNEIAFIEGLIVSEEDHPVRDLSIYLNDEAITNTDLQGYFQMNDLVNGNDYTVVPKKNEDWLEGVSTNDLLIITRHILVVENLDSPYKLIAADVDGSGYISTYDIVQLRQMILQNKTALEINQSWRFIPANYEFPNPQNPWTEAFPEVININDLNGYHQADFVAIKTGDVNLSVFEGVEPRSNRKTSINIDTETFPEGISTINFSLSNPEIEGFQVVLDFGSLNIMALEMGCLTDKNIGKSRLDEGLLFISWNGEAIDGHLFSITVETPFGVELENEIRIIDREIKSEAYLKSGEISSLQIKEIAADEVILYSNFPNPFKEQTQIKFRLPFATEVFLKIYDIQGREYLGLHQFKQKGIHTIPIDAQKLGDSGIYYFSLQANGQILINQAIKLK